MPEECNDDTVLTYLEGDSLNTEKSKSPLHIKNCADCKISSSNTIDKKIILANNFNSKINDYVDVSNKINGQSAQVHSSSRSSCVLSNGTGSLRGLSRRSSEMLGDSLRIHIGNEPLSAHRELINLLDCEPILDYLVQNGVLTRDNVSTIYNHTQHIQQNLALLGFVEVQPSARQLFANVLRLTGQHYLANLVDDTTRIKVLSGSGYLSKSRHTGEISIMIGIKSVKLDEESFKSVASLLCKDWISLEDIQMKISSLKRVKSNHSQRSINVEEENGLDDTTAAMIPDDDDDGGGSCCLCCCKPSRKYKTSKQAVDKKLTNENNGNMNGTGDEGKLEAKAIVITYQPKGGFRSRSHECVSVDDKKFLDDVVYMNEEEGGGNEDIDSSVEDLRLVAHSIQDHSEKFYSYLADPSHNSHVQLVRYFEQDRGVLVLSTNAANDGVAVLCICTKLDHVNSLRTDYNLTGKLTSDLESIICSAELMKECGVVGMKLDIIVNTDNLDSASKELA